VDSANFKPEVIASNLNVCPNDSVVLAADSSYEIYNWISVPATDSSVVVGAGNYVLRATRNGCTVNSDTISILATPNPNPSITGALHYCFDEETVLNVDAGYTSISWSNGATSDSTVADTGGLYVTVMDSNGCIGSDTVIITQSSPAVVISGEVPFCSGDTIQLTANGSGLPVTWNTGSNANTIAASSGTYSVAVMDTNGCSAIDSVALTPLVVPNVTLAINPTSPGGVRQEIAFTGETQLPTDSIIGWIWDFGNGSSDTSQQTSVRYELPGTYEVMLIVTSFDGCLDTIRINYEVVSFISAPNVITPNGDGINDFLVFEGLNFYPDNRLSIYNRWGVSLFSASPYLNNWDAYGLHEGTYFYVLEIPELGDPIKGTIQLLD